MPPLYEYLCVKGHDFEVYASVKDYDKKRHCPECGKDAKKVISAPPMGIVQASVSYDSPIDGRPISSWAQRREDLARSGCVPYDPDKKKDVDRWKRQKDEALERQLDETVEAEIERMPARKKEMLVNELAGGAEAVPERGTVPIKTVKALKGR